MAAIYHPDLDVTIDVAESAVPIHMASGWVPVDGKAQPLPEPVVEGAEATEDSKDEAETKSTTTTKRAAAKES